MTVSKEAFRAALGRFASGVTVVTTRDAEGKPRGVTVAAFASLSLSPPRVLVCLGSASRAHDVVRDAGRYVVNVLAEGQEEASRRFARPGAEPDSFEGIAWREGGHGLPVLTDAIAAIECRVTDALPGGDHTIFVGEVEETTVAEGKPLLYFRGGYARLA
jgi:flavin reductase (DIM6/NTAB) family NADH-FMN oxidoreductase RutF